MTALSGKVNVASQFQTRQTAYGSNSAETDVGEDMRLSQQSAEYRTLSTTFCPVARSHASEGKAAHPPVHRNDRSGDVAREGRAEEDR
jgi:hypothetical protein